MISGLAQSQSCLCLYTHCFERVPMRTPKAGRRRLAFKPVRGGIRNKGLVYSCLYSHNQSRASKLVKHKVGAEGDGEHRLDHHDDDFALFPPTSDRRAPRTFGSNFVSDDFRASV
ncbi:hypothetical protein ISCGN_015325 [Ixodes scapularis]